MKPILTALLLAGLTYAQIGTGSYSGNITDEAGGMISQATIRLEDPATGFHISTSSNAHGAFQLASIPPGTYQLTIEAPGMAKKVIPNFALSASEIVSQTISLAVASAAFSVDVEAAAPSGVRVQTAEAQISRIITLKELDTLPQIGRDPLQLALYSPGVLRNGENSRINGTRNGSTNTKQDGILSVDPVLPRFGLSETVNNVDAISEVRLVLNGGKAEYGRNSGAQVEMVTRKGTNRISGNLFSYHRNTALNANTFFNNSNGVARRRLVQNQFGGSLGGPIRKNRTFFFLNFQGNEIAQDVSRNRTVLTSSARAGIFQWRTPAGALQSFDILANDPRRKGIDPTMARQLSLLPLPNNTLIGDGLNTAGFLFNNPANVSFPQGTARIDHHLSATSRLFFRLSEARFHNIDSGNGNDARYPGLEPGTQDSTNRGFSIGFDWTIRPTLIHELRAGRSSYDVTFAVPRLPGNVIAPASFTSPDFSSAPQGRAVPILEINDNITWIRGAHTFKAGAGWQRSTQEIFNDGSRFPTTSTSRAFNNVPLPTIGPNGAALISAADRNRFESLYNDLLGRVSSISVVYLSDLTSYLPAGTTFRRSYRTQDWNGFFQDDFRLHPKLFLNLGLRYELFQAPIERNGFMGNLDRPAATLGASPVTDFKIQKSSRFTPPDHNNFAPRVGFAYNPFRDGKTSVRGSFGVFYERGIDVLFYALDNNTPGFVFNGQSFPNAAGGADIRLSDNPPIPTAPAAVESVLPLTRSTGILLATDKLPKPYFMHWNFTIQREVARGTVLEVGYVATRGVKLGQVIDVNQKQLAGTPFLADFLQLRAFQATGAAVPASNTLVRLFGTPQTAINSLGAGNFQLGAAGAAAENLDRLFFTRYASVGLPQTYFRAFPQFSSLQVAEATGRSYFDSLQMSLRRDTGWLRAQANYMFSKNIDTIPGDNGDGGDIPLNRFNYRNSRGNSAANLPHTFNLTATVQLPYGKGRRFGQSASRWLRSIAGGWDLGVLARAQSGFAFNIGSPVDTYGGGGYVNYSGPRMGAVERLPNGVRYFTPEQLALFSVPEPGRMGTLGKYFFRGPFNWGMDASVVKRVSVTERLSLMFRLEAYNVTNSVIFGTPATNILTPQTFGRFSGTTNSPRALQGAMRLEF